MHTSIAAYSVLAKHGVLCTNIMRRSSCNHVQWYTTCAVESIAGVTSNTGALVTARHVLTRRQRAAVTAVRCAFVNIYSVVKSYS